MKLEQADFRDVPVYAKTPPIPERLALGTYLANFDGVTHTWNGALYAFVLAIFSAASTRYAVTGGWADTKVAAATANFGVGSNSTSQKAA